MAGRFHFRYGCTFHCWVENGICNSFSFFFRFWLGKGEVDYVNSAISVIYFVLPMLFCYFYALKLCSVSFMLSSSEGQSQWLFSQTRFLSIYQSFIKVNFIYNYCIQLVGCDVISASAMTSHVDTSLPPPDNISSIL